MCGRLSLAGSGATSLSHFNVQESVAWIKRDSLAPGQEVLIVFQTAGAARELRRMRWGLMPSWPKDPAIASQIINARAETIAIRPTFADHAVAHTILGRLAERAEIFRLAGASYRGMNRCPASRAPSTEAKPRPPKMKAFR